jgi:hypothetical protein
MAPSGKTKFFTIMILLLAAFLVGYVPLYQKNRKLEAELKDSQYRLAEVQEQFHIAILHNELGLILIEVEKSNFGIAKDRSSRFFDNLRQVTSSVHDDTIRERLMAVLKRQRELFDSREQVIFTI